MAGAMIWSVPSPAKAPTVPLTDEQLAAQREWFEDLARQHQELTAELDEAAGEWRRLRAEMVKAGERVNKVEAELASVQTELDGVMAGLSRRGHDDVVQEVVATFGLEESSDEDDPSTLLRAWSSKMPPGLRDATVQVTLRTPDGETVRRVLRGGRPWGTGTLRQPELELTPRRQAVLAAEPAPAEPPQWAHDAPSTTRDEWASKTRTDATFDVLNEAARPLSPKAIARALRRVGRDDSPRDVSAALAHLKRNGRVHSPEYGAWAVLDIEATND